MADTIVLKIILINGITKNKSYWNTFNNTVTILWSAETNFQQRKLCQLIWRRSRCTWFIKMVNSDTCRQCSASIHLTKINKKYATNQSFCHDSEHINSPIFYSHEAPVHPSDTGRQTVDFLIGLKNCLTFGYINLKHITLVIETECECTDWLIYWLTEVIFHRLNRFQMTHVVVDILGYCIHSELLMFIDFLNTTIHTVDGSRCINDIIECYCTFYWILYAGIRIMITGSERTSNRFVNAVKREHAKICDEDCF